jgi:hypothetical protein
MGKQPHWVGTQLRTRTNKCKHNETAGSPFAVILGTGDEMERDAAIDEIFDPAIDEILAFASGDIRLALRVLLVECVLLEEELQQMRAASPTGGRTSSSRKE